MGVTATGPRGREPGIGRRRRGEVEKGQSSGSRPLGLEPRERPSYSIGGVPLFALGFLISVSWLVLGERKTRKTRGFAASLLVELADPWAGCILSGPGRRVMDRPWQPSGVMGVGATPGWIMMDYLGRKLFCQMRPAFRSWKCPALTFLGSPSACLPPLLLISSLPSNPSL